MLFSKTDVNVMGVSSGQFAMEAASLVGSSFETGRPVAVKLLHPELADVDQVVQRFEREGKVTTQLSHPQVIEFGEWSR